MAALLKSVKCSVVFGELSVNLLWLRLSRINALPALRRWLHPIESFTLNFFL